MRFPVAVLIVVCLLAVVSAYAQPQFELTNNWLTNVSWLTGTDRGVEQNLDDNYAWMVDQGYTHLRFFGIYPNGVHIFPSPTLDAHGYPNSNRESHLASVVERAVPFGITVNFDGWEVIAEANQDTTELGVGYIDEDELAMVVADALAQGVTLITEEQFGGTYLQAIQAVTSQAGARHETTAGVWWTRDDIADEQLVNVFSFYPYDQEEADSIMARSSLPANLGNVHIWAEGAHYYGIPLSLAVGSFGSMATENWKNVMIYTQIQHRPERFSVEETNWDFLLNDPDFNFTDHVGQTLIDLADATFGERPTVNVVYDASALFGGAFRPAISAMLVNGPAVANTFTGLGYRVIPTIDSIIPGAAAYFLQLAGGENAANVAPLPDYVMSLLERSAPVMIQPAFGIPDFNDAPDWQPLRQYFGLPVGETATLSDRIPVSVDYNGYPVLWGGAAYTITPRLESIAAAQINTDSAEITLSAPVAMQDVALVVQHGNKWLINSNVIHLEAAYILSHRLSGPHRRPTGADVAMDSRQAVVFAEYDTEVDIDLPWPGRTHLVRRDPAGNITQELDTAIANGYATQLVRGELVWLSQVPGICGDADDNLSITSGDIIYLVNYVFKGGAPLVHPSSGDVNSSGVVDSGDIIYLVNFIFKAGPSPACP